MQLPHLLQLSLLRLLYTFAPWTHLGSFPSPSATYCLPISLLFPSESKENSKLEVEKTELVDYPTTVRHALLELTTFLLVSEGPEHSLQNHSRL